MPSEIRQIIFNNDELLDAIRQYNAQSKVKLPQGSFNLCQPVEDGEVGALVEIDDAMSGKTERMILKGSYVAAALVNACLRSRIPLPRNAKKSLRVVKDGMALHLKLRSSNFGAVQNEPQGMRSAGAAASSWEATGSSVSD